MIQKKHDCGQETHAPDNVFVAENDRAEQLEIFRSLIADISLDYVGEDSLDEKGVELLLENVYAFVDGIETMRKGH